MSDIAIPLQVKFRYKPRPYQRDFLQAMARGIKRAVLVWHRRAGKDLTVLQWLVIAALKRVGTYYYFFPTFNQGRKVLWDGMDREGVKFLNYIPAEIVADKNETEMQITLKNGSIIQVVGSDKIDNIVGTNPVGCVFSEFSIQNPRGWNLVSPILTENLGWAVFVFTPRGKNHGHDIYEVALKKMREGASWFAQLLTVSDTRRDDGSPVVTASDIQEEVDRGMDEDLVQQEYFCSFSGSQQGSYYGQQIVKLRNEGHVCKVDWIPALPVFVSWDLGFGDANALWFAQLPQPQRVNVIDFYLASGQGLPHYAKICKEKPYVYARHFLPHDIRQHELSSGLTREETFRDLAVGPYTVLKKVPVKEGIDASRKILPLCYFDDEKCDRKKWTHGKDQRHSGLDALLDYHKEYDDERYCFKDTPEHNWSSNPADSFRYLALGVRLDGEQSRRQLTAENDYAVFGKREVRFSDNSDNPDNPVAESDYSIFGR